MFSYMDAEPHRPSLQALFEDYWRLMPDYQAVQLEQLSFKRCLFGYFPTYRQAHRCGWRLAATTVNA